MIVTSLLVRHFNKQAYRPNLISVAYEWTVQNGPLFCNETWIWMEICTADY